MEKKIEYKLEGKMVLVKATLSEKIDTDKDGIPLLKVMNVTDLELDGVELINEMFKSTEFFGKIANFVKEKFGVNLGTDENKPAAAVVSDAQPVTYNEAIPKQPIA